MARSRNIKPAIMDNEQLAELPALTRLLFIYLWMLADREGRLEDRPKRIGAQALPYDRTADPEEMLAVLCSGGFIARFEVAGKRVIEIVNFNKHQAPHGTEKDSELPDSEGLFSVHERGKNGYASGVIKFKNAEGIVVKQASNKPLTVKEPPDSLIPDTGFTDSPIPDSPIPDSSSSSGQGPDGVEVAKKAPKPRRHHGTDEDHRAVMWMFKKVRVVDATAKEPHWDSWANDMRLMREQDSRTHREACELFEWANADSFWKTNILSPAKLREQWQQLSLKRQASSIAGRPGALHTAEAANDSMAKAERLRVAMGGAPPTESLTPPQLPDEASA